MPTPLVRYPLDRTGVNPDNLVSSEFHALVNKPVRVVVPTYGPYYSDTVIVIDKTTNAVLTRGTQFQCVEILQEATLKYGKEIAQIILIVDPTVTGEVLVTYQVLGGLYGFDMSAIVNMYESLNIDRRPVDWLNVLNKPYEYPPTLHNHVLEDVYGFEYIVVALERIRNALVLSNIPAFEFILNWVNERTLDTVSTDDIDNLVPSNTVVTFEMLLYYMEKQDFCRIHVGVTPDRYLVAPGELLPVTIETTCTPNEKYYFWTIEHISTTYTDFDISPLSGKVNMVGKVGTFTLPIAINAVSGHELNQFRIVIRAKSVISKIVATSGIITIGIIEPELIDYKTACCLFNPGINISAEGLFFLED